MKQKSNSNESTLDPYLFLTAAAQLHIFICNPIHITGATRRELSLFYWGTFLVVFLQDIAFYITTFVVLFVFFG